MRCGVGALSPVCMLVSSFFSQKGWFSLTDIQVTPDRGIPVSVLGMAS
jgi:hypothetical protein